MATVTSTPTTSNLTVSGKTEVSGTISWSIPTVLSGATISSCVLTGTATATMSKGSATIKVNGTTVKSGQAFTINLGTTNSTTSVTTTAVGGRNASGTVSFSGLVYTVTYVIYHTVTFKDWDGTVLKTQTVEQGTSAAAPNNPTRDGYSFTGWDKTFSSITSDLTVTAQYVKVVYYTVTFVDWNGTVLKTQTVESGSSATAPSNPNRDGYAFIGWDKTFNNVTSDLTVTAKYEEESEGPNDNELIQGGINDETGSFEDEITNIVKTNFIDISDKKQIMVQVLTENVYVLKAYLYNANKELVKVLDISSDKKRVFGVDLQKLIEEVINDGNE